MAHEQRAPEALRPSSEAEEPEQSGPVDGEARWPMAGAVIAAIVLTLLLPKQERPGPNWLLPLIEVAPSALDRTGGRAGSQRALGNGGVDRSPHLRRP